MSDVPRPSRAYLICQVAGWGTFGILGVSMARAFGYGSPRVDATTLLGVLIGAALTHLWRGVILGRGLLRLGFSRLLPRLAIGVVVVALAAELLVWGAGLFVTHAYTLKGSTAGVMFATTANWLFTMMLWTAIYAGANAFVSWRDSEIQRLRLAVLARDAQLEALHAQIQPHFLFNAMNVLRALISEEPARARDLVTELSELMRYALQSARRERVKLAEELAVVESYLSVESARFEERLAWRIDADDAIREVRLPPMLLQPLVENAVKHGIAAREEGGEVTIEARRDGERLRLTVTNPGCLSGRGDTRIGLQNARERLRLIFGERAGLTLTERDGRVVAELTLPPGDPA
jgi:signal transduction histidine kinase